MKRCISAAAVAAVAVMALAGTASADVPRYQLQDATFTVTQPNGAVGVWSSLWTHKYTVAVNPCDSSFTGTGTQYDNAMQEVNTETVTGTLGAHSLTYSVVRDDGVEWTLTDAPYGGAVTLAVTDPVVSWPVEMKVTQPIFTNTGTIYKNHGQYVKEQGSDAAHSCIGMPIVSAPFEWTTNGTVDSASLTGTNVLLPIAGNYRIDVTGTWNNDGWGWVDAEYADNGAGSYANGFDRSGYLLGEGFGDLRVNGLFVDWGAYSPVHAYTLAMPLAGTVNLTVFDGNSNPPPEVMPWYGDNTGSLTYAITYVGP